MKKLVGILLLSLSLAVVLAGCAPGRQNKFCTVTFDTGGLCEVASVQVEKGTAFVLPQPSARYNLFKGWFRTPERTGDPAPDPFVPASDMTLYAKWEGYLLCEKYVGGYGVSLNPDIPEYPLDVVVPREIDGKTISLIANSAFRGSNIESVSIPDSVRFVGAEAFAQCDRLQAVSLSGGIETLNDKTFYQCVSLTDIDLTGVRAIGSSVFDGCARLERLELPETLVAIGNYAFRHCVRLGDTIFPSGLQTIGKYAFDSCASLSRVELPDSVTKVSMSAFSGCAALTSVRVGRNTTSLGSYAFQGDVSLREIYLPLTLRSVEHAAFDRCNALETVFYQGNVDRWNTINFGYLGCPQLENAAKMFEYAY